MNIEILCVGKIKEAYLKDAIAEYSKRLSKYCTLKITETEDEKTVDKQSAAEDELVKKREGERLLKHLKEQAFVVVLDIEGRMMDSVGFSKLLADTALRSVSHIQFVIGGSLGLCPEIINKADLKLSFSKMTFPHQLMRVILLEQVYRAYRIMHHEPYHK